jgi:propionyl-CoA carboxylase alpha chain
MYYDPMIAKLCTWAPTASHAIDAMSEALDNFVVDGIEHNIPFLSALMQHPRWREGRLSTGFIAEEYPDGFSPRKPDDKEKRFWPPLPSRSNCAAATGSTGCPAGWRRIRARSSRTGWSSSAMITSTCRYLRGHGLGRRFEADLSIGGGKPVTVVSDWRFGDPVWVGVVGGTPCVGADQAGAQRHETSPGRACR